MQNLTVFYLILSQFGWNACFGSSGEGSSNVELTDNDLEAILDRTRGENVLTDQEKNKKRIISDTVRGNNVVSAIDNGSSSSGNHADSNNSSSNNTDQNLVRKRKMPTNVNSPSSMSPTPVHKRSSSQYLQEEQQCTAADFEESAPMISLRIFDGEEFEKKKFTNSDISSEWGKRKRGSRLTEMHVPGVGLMKVLKSNMYTLQEGEPSIFEKETTSSVLIAKANGEEMPKSRRVSWNFVL